MRDCRLCLFVWLYLAVGLAQHHEMKPPAEKPVRVLYKGLGNWRHPIATKTPRRRILRSGPRAALRLQPLRGAAVLPQGGRNWILTAAMPWWGMAMSTGPYVNMGSEGDGDLDSEGRLPGGGEGP